MGINMNSAKRNSSKAREYASDMDRIKNNLNQKKADLMSAWRADEMKYVNNAIEKTNQKLNSISSELDAIAADILSVAYEIKQEEEERERQAAAAAAATKK
jgi:uncharacterized protein YukE